VNHENSGVIDFNFVEKINQGAGEGGLLHGGPNQTLQLLFVFTVLKAIMPRSLIEIGTHRANFCYLAKIALPECKITTFGIDPKSAQAVEAVNEKIGTRDIEVVLGNSLETVPLHEGKFDMAWVDGGHDFNTALQDLENCAKKVIPFIMVDDIRMPDVQRALVEFMRIFSEYKIVWMSSDARGTVVLSLGEIEEMTLWNQFTHPFFYSVQKSILFEDPE
jgi:predicted O-methyltransferase YrrM